MNNLRFARLPHPQVWSARKREKRVSVRCGEIRRNVGQEVKEVDRDLSVVCPGRQLNLWGARHKNIICVESFPRAAFCEWGFPGGLVRGDLVSPASDSVRYLYPGGDFGVSLSS